MAKKKTVTILETDSGLKARKEFSREKTGKTVPCPGEDHSNAFIDHCGVCMPRWGVLEEYEEPIRLERALSVLNQDLAVRVNDLSPEAHETLRRTENVKLVSHTRNNSHTYFVFVKA